MENVLILGEKACYLKVTDRIRCFERAGDIRVCGIYLSENDMSGQYPYVTAADREDISCILWCAKRVPEDMPERDREKLVPAELLELPGFTFTRYMALVRSRLTILCNVCWGGITSHYFRLPFLSPTVNMFIPEDAYIRFLEELPQLLAKEPVYREDAYSEDEHHMYPVLDLDGISLHMNHAYRKEDALAAWNRRRARVNPGNILAVMITDSVSEARRFEELPYEKKVCFVPFETDLPHSFTVDSTRSDLIEHMNTMAAGYHCIYDPWILLEEGKAVRMPVTDDTEDNSRTPYILIYGAALLGRKAYDRVVQNAAERLLGFAVSAMAGNPQMIESCPVRDISSWTGYLKQKGIPLQDVTVIMALHPQYYHEVENKLKQEGITNVIPLEETAWYLTR